MIIKLIIFCFLSLCLFPVFLWIVSNEYKDKSIACAYPKSIFMRTSLYISMFFLIISPTLLAGDCFDLEYAGKIYKLMLIPVSFMPIMIAIIVYFAIWKIHQDEKNIIEIRKHLTWWKENVKLEYPEDKKTTDKIERIIDKILYEIPVYKNLPPTKEQS